MELSVLTNLSPIVEELIRRSPQMKKWFEKRAAEDDPAFFFQLQSLQATREVGQAMADWRSYTLLTSIMSAKLANPSLTNDQIRQQFISSIKVAGEIRDALERISPQRAQHVSG